MLFHGGVRAARYNSRLLDTCATLKAECIDLANRIPKSLGFFYDNMHLNDAGSGRVADELVAYFRAHPPFAGPAILRDNHPQAGKS